MAVSSLPDPYPATLGGFSGSGYALVRRHGPGRISCDGAFFTTDQAATGALRRTVEVPFEGVVYSGDAQERCAMPVLIHSRKAYRGLLTFLFVSRGDPYQQDQAPGLRHEM